MAGDARALPFPDQAFDLSISVTALCFIHEQRQALAEILRVTRRRIAIGLINRYSLLYLHKGRGDGRGAHQGAHWHTVAEVRALFTGITCQEHDIANRHTASYGCPMAMLGERQLGARIPGGASWSWRAMCVEAEMNKIRHWAYRFDVATPAGSLQTSLSI